MGASRAVRAWRGLVSAGAVLTLAGRAGAVPDEWSLTSFDAGWFVSTGTVPPPMRAENLQLVWNSAGESRLAMEFAIPVFPAGTVVNAAELELRVGGLNGSTAATMVASFHGYAADLEVTRNDAVGRTPNELGRTVPIGFNTSPLPPVSLNLAKMQALVDQQPRGIGLWAWSETFTNELAVEFSNGSTSRPRLTLGVDVPRVGTLEVPTFVDGEANNVFEGTVPTVVDGDATMRSFASSGGISDVAIMHFDARGLPRGVAIRSAQLVLDVSSYTSNSVDGDPVIRPHIKYGNGSLFWLDAFSGVEAGEAVIDKVGPVSVGLDRLVVEELLNLNAPLVAVNIPAPANGLQAVFKTAEWEAQFGSGLAPRLILDYGITDGATPGDANLDETVDLLDALTLRDAFTGRLAAEAGPANWFDGDFDGDRDVDLADVLALRANFVGDPAQVDALFAALIPEPAAAVALAPLLAVARPRRRRHA